VGAGKSGVEEDEWKLTWMQISEPQYFFYRQELGCG
jgi:hypothetical protein